MKVTLRKSKINDLKYSLFLDIIHDGTRKKEYLKLQIFIKPKDPVERLHNTNILSLAGKVKTKRELELQNAVHGFAENNHNANFIEYFKNYVETYDKANYRMYHALFAHFNAFLVLNKKTIITGRSVTPILCEDFGEYLKTKLNHETPANYFNAFRRVLRRAKKERIVDIDLDDVKVKFIYDKTAIRKQLLSASDIEAMVAVRPPNVEVALAFLFCLNTGLDFATVSRVLTWSMVDGDYIVFDRSKTGKQNRIKINETVKGILDGKEKTKGLIFKLPSWTGCVKSIRTWAKSAGVDKKITWHSARHTLGNMLVNDFNTNLRVVQEIFGHTSSKPTMRYTQIRSDTKDKAVDQLPLISLAPKKD